MLPRLNSKAQFWLAAGMTLVVYLSLFTVVAFGATREMPYKKYMQDPRVLTALSIAVTELSACEAPLTFQEKDATEDSPGGVIAVVRCGKYPDSNGKFHKAHVNVDMATDEDGNPVGPIVFDYNLPE